MMSIHEWLFLLLRDPFALLVLLLIVLIPTAFFGWALYVDYQIGSQGVSVNADVTWQMVYNNDPDSLNHEYGVKYKFSPDGGGKKYSASGIYKYLLVTVPKEDYYRAQRTKKLEVLYLRDHPQLNRPKNCHTVHKIGVFLLLFFGASLSLLIGVLVAAHYRYAPQEPHFQQPAMQSYA